MISIENPQSLFAAVELGEGMKGMFGKGLQKRGQIFGGIDFNHGELPNPSIVATEIFETTREPKVLWLRLWQGSSFSNYFCSPRNKIPTVDRCKRLRREIPIADQFRPKVVLREPVAAAYRANLQICDGSRIRLMNIQWLHDEPLARGNDKILIPFSWANCSS